MCAGLVERPTSLVDSIDSIACFGIRGEVARYDVSGLGIPWGSSGFSVAPDGAIWVLGPQVARLATALPSQ